MLMSTFMIFRLKTGLKFFDHFDQRLSIYKAVFISYFFEFNTERVLQVSY